MTNIIQTKNHDQHFSPMTVSEVKQFLELYYSVHRRRLFSVQYYSYTENVILLLSMVHKKAQEARSDKSGWYLKEDLVPAESEFRMFSTFEGLLPVIKAGLLEFQKSVALEQYRLNYETIGQTLVGKEDLLETMALERECEQLDLEIAESVYEKERRYHLQTEEWSIDELVG